MYIYSAGHHKHPRNTFFYKIHNSNILADIKLNFGLHTPYDLKIQVSILRVSAKDNQ